MRHTDVVTFTSSHLPRYPLTPWSVISFSIYGETAIEANTDTTPAKVFPGISRGRNCAYALSWFEKGKERKGDGKNSEARRARLRRRRWVCASIGMGMKRTPDTGDIEDVVQRPRRTVIWPTPFLASSISTSFSSRERLSLAYIYVTAHTFQNMPFYYSAAELYDYRGDN